MDSYTGMSEEAIAATVKAMRDTGQKYPMELAPHDFANLLIALQVAWQHVDPDLAIEHEYVSDWIYSFVSSIGETLGVEHI